MDNMKKILVIAAMAASFSAFSQEYLPEWTEGCFDICAIATGKGESTFLQFPDGTTMLIDLGDIRGNKWNGVAVPDDSKTPAQWCAEFVNHFSKRGKIDYFLLSHLHADHFGAASATKEKVNGYLKAGIMEFGEYMPIGKIIDRGYPDYDFPIDWRSKTAGSVRDYIKFVEYQTAHNGVKAEKIKVGSHKQVTLLNNPKAYRNFDVWNVAANCEVTTGKGSRTVKHVLKGNAVNNENQYSIVQVFSYGKFKYYSGGDIAGSGWLKEGHSDMLDIESKVADAIGSRVTVAKMDHHGCPDTGNAYFLWKLRPQAFLVSCSEAKHPWNETVARIMDKRTPCGKLIFPTQYTGRDNLGSELQSRLQPAGHVVVRVYPGGESYQIFVLNSLSRDYEVIYKTDIIKLK